MMSALVTSALLSQQHSETALPPKADSSVPNIPQYTDVIGCGQARTHGEEIPYFQRVHDTAMDSRTRTHVSKQQQQQAQ